MQLLNLINGFPGAPSGTAEVFVSGSTASLATVYADAAGAATLTNPVILDANGSATAYVDAIVDIVIKTSTGSIAKARYTPEGVDAMIETSGPSFTGANPVTGALAVNQPIGLDTVLDRWVTSAGAPDWKVLRTGQSAAETIIAALAAVTSTTGTVFFNVRTYGALGNGSTDDATAFESAVAAAIAAGGGIVFVPGSLTNYVLSRSIAIASPRVSFLGVGALASVLSVSQAVPALAWTGGVTTGSQATCEGIGFTASSAFATSLLTLATIPGFVVRSCRFSVVTPGVTTGAIAASSACAIRDCSFANAGGAGIGITGAGSLIDRCRLEATATCTYLVTTSVANVCLAYCFHETGATSTYLFANTLGSTVTPRFIGNHLATAKAIFLATNTYDTYYEVGTSYTDTVTAGASSGPIPRNTFIGPATTQRSWRQPYLANSPGATYVPTLAVVTHELTITGVLTINAFIDACIGDQFTIIVFNNSAGALNVTWNAAYNVSVSPTSVAAAQRMRIDFVVTAAATARALDVAQVFA